MDNLNAGQCLTHGIKSTLWRRFASQADDRTERKFENRALKLLIADDSDLVRERLVGLLAPLVGSANIVEADNVDTTLIQIAQTRPDVLVLDLDMPGGSGFEVLDAIGEWAIRPLIIVLTNYGEPEIQNLCLRSGAHYFFDKSTEFEHVPDIVDALMKTDRSKFLDT